MNAVSGSSLWVWGRGSAIVVATLVALLAASATAHARGLKLVQVIGTGGSGLPLTSPHGVAVNNVPSSPCYGDIYVVDRDRSEVEIGGSTIFFGSNVWHFNSEGEFEGTQGEFGSGDGDYKRPFGIAIDNQGNVLVTDSWYAQGEVPNARVQMFTCELDFITKWGVPVPNGFGAIEMDHMRCAGGHRCRQRRQDLRGRQRLQRRPFRAGRQPDSEILGTGRLRAHLGPGRTRWRTGGPDLSVVVQARKRFHHG
jgi:hypothetical protein